MKDNILIEEKLLILEIFEENINKDLNLNKSFLDNYNYFISNVLNSVYAKQDKAKLSIRIFKILKKISEDKNDLSCDIALVLREFLFEYLDRDEINYKILSFSLFIMNKINFSFEFLIKIIHKILISNDSNLMNYLKVC